MNERVRRALVSVHDKEGIVDFCVALQALGVEILSSGGTAKLLGEHGLRVTSVSDHTGFPEMLGGRVKTLHPRIHAGILAVRSNAEHMEELRRAEIAPIDLVVVNLYPFEKTAAVEGLGLPEVVEMIDIGGPALVRAAAKNFAHVAVVVQPRDYAGIVEELRRDGTVSAETRLRLATEAFKHTASYDGVVHAYLRSVIPGERDAGRPEFPERLQLDLFKAQELRYGENPHQRAAYYREPLAPSSFANCAVQLQGLPLSFNNILDFDGALALVADFADCAAAIVKHGNPCGAALGPEPLTAFGRALECDPLSAFGGVIAFNRPVDARTAVKITEQFYEGVIAPGFDPEARQALGGKKKLRLLEVGDVERLRRPGFDVRRVHGGFLVQDWDRLEQDLREARAVTRRQPTEVELRSLAFAWTVVKHVRSNAIVFAVEDRTIGIGAGQMSRVDSVRLGISKARVPLVGAVMASDAFFPFRDGIDAAAAAGVGAVVQPGGSVRDEEVVAAADQHGIAMIFTGRRHFRH